LDRAVRAIYFIALAACTTATTTTNTQLPPGSPLDVDMYFAFATGPTPCNTPVIDACIFELGFCSDGTYSYKSGDIITPGTYVFDEYTLVDAATGFQFNLQTDYSDDKNNNNLGPWMTTTVSIAPDVACTQ
jgi:hypothetical protein